jgi:hypothetical protein
MQGEEKKTTEYTERGTEITEKEQGGRAFIPLLSVSFP